MVCCFFFFVCVSPNREFPDGSGGPVAEGEGSDLVRQGQEGDGPPAVPGRRVGRRPLGRAGGHDGSPVSLHPPLPKKKGGASHPPPRHDLLLLL